MTTAEEWLALGALLGIYAVLNEAVKRRRWAWAWAAVFAWVVLTLWAVSFLMTVAEWVWAVVDVVGFVVAVVAVVIDVIQGVRHGDD